MSADLALFLTGQQNPLVKSQAERGELHADPDGFLALCAASVGLPAPALPAPEAGAGLDADQRPAIIPAGHCSPAPAAAPAQPANTPPPARPRATAHVALEDGADLLGMQSHSVATATAVPSLPRPIVRMEAGEQPARRTAEMGGPAPSPTADVSAETAFPTVARRDARPAQVSPTSGELVPASQSLPGRVPGPPLVRPQLDAVLGGDAPAAPPAQASPPIKSPTVAAAPGERPATAAPAGSLSAPRQTTATAPDPRQPPAETRRAASADKPVAAAEAAPGPRMETDSAFTATPPSKAPPPTTPAPSAPTQPAPVVTNALADQPLPADRGAEPEGSARVQSAPQEPNVRPPDAGDDRRPGFPPRESERPRAREGTRPIVRLSPTGDETTAMQVRAAETSGPPPREAPTVTLRPVHRATSLELTEERPQRLTLEVDPPELGRCELELSLHEGRVRASVITERPETALALRAVESHVREQLAARQMHIAEFDIRADTHASGQQSFGRGASHGGGARQSRSEHPTRPDLQRFFGRDPARSSLRSARRSTIDLVA